MSGRTLGIDLGKRWVGLALSDPLGITAQALGLIDLAEADLLVKLQELISTHEVTRLVVGLPRNMDGSLGRQAVQALELAERLKDELRLPVETWDERLTTVQAERALQQGQLSLGRRKKHVDTIAAQLILQGFLDAHRNP